MIYVTRSVEKVTYMPQKSKIHSYVYYGWTSTQHKLSNDTNVISVELCSPYRNYGAMNDEPFALLRPVSIMIEFRANRENQPLKCLALLTQMMLKSSSKIVWIFMYNFIYELINIRTITPAVHTGPRKHSACCLVELRRKMSVLRKKFTEIKDAIQD